MLARNLIFGKTLTLEWKKCLWSVVERWIEEMIPTLAGQFVGLMCSFHKLTCSRLSGFIAQLVLEHCTGITEVMGLNPVEDMHLKFFRCTYETVVEIVQQVWGSLLLQFALTLVNQNKNIFHLLISFTANLCNYKIEDECQTWIWFKHS